MYIDTFLSDICLGLNTVYIHTFIQPHSYNTFIHCHSLRPLSISSYLVCSVGKHLPVVPRRESNSSLPYSKPTRYKLSHAAPSFKARKIKSLFYVHVQMVFNCLAWLVQEKKKYNFLLAPLKTLTNSKNCFKRCIKFLFQLCFPIVGQFSPA